MTQSTTDSLDTLAYVILEPTAGNRSQRRVVKFVTAEGEAPRVLHPTGLPAAINQLWRITRGTKQ
jgi:hypothetical protein